VRSIRVLAHSRKITAGPRVAIRRWLAVFPTLTVLNLAFSWLKTLSPVARTSGLATVAFHRRISADVATR
jgi:hypothetical protein